MSAETSIKVSITSTVGTVSIPRVDYTTPHNRSNTGANIGTLLASDTATQLQITGTVTEDVFSIRNVGPTNDCYVQTGSSGSTGRFAILKPGGAPCVFAVASGVSIYVICGTSLTTDVSFVVLSN